ncbi:MAG: hypothetical protein FJ134_08560 [Deltaproteobacteria bacterium]|nr:hypothetical protein [Deltaproteobacteria bacterium]
MTEIEQLCAKVKAIAQGPNADLLKKFIDLLYQEEEPEYFSPEDLAAIEEGMKASLSGDRSQFIPWEEYKAKRGL